MPQPRPSPATLAVRVYLPFALGYFLSYVFRVVNAVIAGDLRADLGLDSSVLGLLTATYFLTFAAFQLPLGYLLDRFGPRRVEAALLLVAALGAFVFSLSGTVAGLILGRALIGLGVSACLMAAFKAFVDWFPVDRLPRINGWQMAAGGLGALFATRPVELSLPLLGWEGVFQVLGVMCVLAAAVVFFVVPDKPRPKQNPATDRGLGFAAVFTHPLFIRVAPLSMASQASFLAVSGLWAGTWLQDVAGLTRSETANVLAAMTLAMIAGYLALGFLASWLGRRGVSTFTTATTCVVASIVPLLAMVLMESAAPPWLCWIAFGFAGTGNILYYAGLSQHFPGEMAGRVNTALNLLVFVAAFALQWGFGVVIDQWSGNEAFSLTGYRVALSALVILQLLAVAWYLFSRAAKGASPLQGP